ncbi:hypothetical protein PHSY_001158 [Pseudozyma hubeiensis SY62]|uniref:Pre-rRNA processing protein n=1 Tax=Pseudozyma hubeiensis (strain SY62) TaxID=1305764 RepID=R9NXX6_PSEHS|nr:hypothetical protein PHSY_001158 [Pseudozyma hubeiensis SY62]GAC93593.1 hypothetical protein PHSY_001158 [Pseudozyma hubeiensis SY62]
MTPSSQRRRGRSNGEYDNDNDNDDGQHLMRQRTRTSSNYTSTNSKYGDRNHYQPGQPIGFLAARNTIYAKKVNSRKLRCCLFLVMPIAILVGLVILTGPVLFAVANHIVNVSVVHLESLEISTTQPGPGEYPVSLRARVTKTGIFPARAYFRAPINLYWRTVPPNSREIHIGTIEIDHLGVTSRGYGTLDEKKTLTNVDDDNLALFARFLVNAEQATIKLNCSNVHPVAFGFLPSWHNIAVSKHANIAGLKGLGDVKVLSLDVPGDSPQGGAIVNAVGSLKNPSPFSIQLGNADLQVSYKDMPLAEANLTNFHLGNGVNTVPVDGRIYHQQGDENLAKLSELVGILTNNEAAPVSIKVNPTSETTPSWVKAAVDELNIVVPVKLPQPFDPIKAVQVGAMDVMLDPAQSYSPTLNSNSVSADVEIPFGLSLSVLSAAVHIDVSSGNDGGVATLNGAQANASSALELIGPSKRGGKTFLSLINSTMSPSSNTKGGEDEAKKGFQQLIREIALGNTINLAAKGTAAVVADSSIGRITLPALKIATSTSLQGLSGFAQAPLDLLSFDILGGSSSALQVVASASITNPSLISIHLLGDTSFPLALPNGAGLGRSTISEVRLVPGTNTVNVTAAVSFNDKSKSLVQQYLQGKGSQVNVRGDADSSQAESLKPTMESLKLNASIAGLTDPLLLSAAMRILDTTAVVNDIADAIPSVGNPFTSAISLRGSKGQASVLGLNVGHVDAMKLQNAVVIPSRNEVNRQSDTPLPVIVDFDKPNMIFGLMRGLVVESGQDTAPLDYLMKVGGIKPVGVKQSASSLPTLSLRAAPFDGFSLPKYVMTALAAARADVQVDVDVLIGDYPLSTPFQQSGVNVTFDNSIEKLYSILGRPIMQAVIDAVQINLDSIQVLDLAQNKVVVDVSTAITKIGPFDAVVMLDKGIDVSWQGKVIGNVALPNVTIVPETTPLQVRAELTIADTGLMTDLVKALLQQESVEWTLSTSSMVIYAYDAVLNGPGLTKKTSIRAFNKLQNAVALGPFDLPANDPAGGIHITASATVRNPSNIGVNLDRLGVNFGLTTSTLGEVGLANVLNMTASGTSTVNVAGRILPQSGQGLTDFSTVAQNFISNKPTTLTVRGVYAGPDSVTWLTDGIKTLSIPITVPGIVLDPLKSVSLNSTTIDFTQAGGEWSPLLSTDTVAAAVEIPFGFPFGVESVGGSFDVLYGGQGAARLVLSDSAARTQDRTVSLAIQNAHLDIPGNYRNNFANDLAVRAVQDQSISVGLNSNAVNALVSTASGDISVKGIPIHLDPALALDAFQRLSTSPIVISGLDVTGGTRDYAIATVNAAIVNPSQVHAIVGDVRMQVDYGNGGSIGDALVRNVNIPQGPITLPVEAQLKLNSEVGRQLIKDFLTRGGPDIQALAHGTSRSTAYGSLNPAVSTLSFGASVARLNETLVTTAKLIVPPNVDKRLIVAATFVLHNPFSAQITVLHAKASATSLSGALLGTVDADVNMVAPGHSTLTSPQFPVRVNTDFAAVIGFFEDQAKANNVDLAPLLPLIDPLKSRSNLDSNVAFAPAQSEGCPLNGATDVIGALQRSLQGAQVSADAQANVLVGQYRINDVPVQLQPIALEVDDSVRYLIGPFGAPVVESIVNSFTLQVANISASNLAEDGLDVSVSVTIGGIGPFAAQVSFGKPLEARYNGKRIATVNVPTFCLPADGRLDLNVRLTVTDQNGFGDFVSDLIAQPELELEIYSDDVRANAYGVQFSKISLSRSISLQGLKGLRGVLAKTVSVVGETSDTLLVEADATVPWPTSIRVVLPIINVDFKYENVVLGGVHVPAGVVLAPNTDTDLHVTGQVNRLTNNAQSTALGHLATRFISTNTTAVEVVGNSATDANGQNIPWLTRALKTLDLSVDVAGQNLNPVKGVNLPDLYADLTAAKDSGYQLPLSTNRTEAIVSIPYNIHVDAVSASGTVYVAAEGSTARAASVILDQLPLVSGAIAGNNQSNTLTLSLNNQLLVAVDRAAFQQLLVVVVSKPTTALRIFGQVSAVVDLAVGRITVDSVNLDVPASLQSLDNLSGQLSVIGLADVVGGTPEHGIAMIKATLHNPSVISAKVAQLSIPVTLDGVGIGRAVLENLDIKPGDNTVSVTVYIKLDEPLGSPTAVKLIRQLIQPVPGTHDPYITTLYAHNQPGAQPPITTLEAINPALDTLNLKVDLTGFAMELIRQATISIEVLDLFAGPGGLPYVLADIDLANSLPTELALYHIVADGSKAGSSKTYATLDHTFDPSLILPKAAATNVNPGQAQAHIDKVLLPMGLLNSIDIVGSPLDLYITTALIKIGGDNGYQLQGELTYLSVPATYRLTLAGAAIANIDSLGGLLSALGGIVGSLSPNEQKLLSDGLQNLGTGNILGLVDNGFKDLVCVLNDLPIPLLSQANCAQATSTTASVSRQSCHMNRRICDELYNENSIGFDIVLHYDERSDDHLKERLLGTSSLLMVSSLYTSLKCTHL